ncbi:tryptophan halogenase family protein [Kordiimonas lipolytica]|uniref:Tryptophan halogenase family protein n=1 Tax=Kordiimonas lipolytica TaxID=1662421 RepID=A0ABV8U8L4_9PROT|nr:tryptophan halogenase family protein [Kordiimonas lipolytica]
MQKDSIKKLVIVGGGTAGWMAASLLVKLMRGQLEIVLIESDDIGTVGVGEATIPPIQIFNNVLGLNEDEFIKATQGTFKLGIQFENWGAVGDKYMHAFGAIGRQIGMVPFQHYWLRAKAAGFAGDLWDFSFNYQAAKQDRFDRLRQIPNSPLEGITHAFHFDAGLYARYLRKGCEHAGVNRVEGMITDVSLDGESGNIESVTLKDGQVVEGDFFIDCSGFRSLLLGQALGVGYTDWTDWLPCDRAVAVPAENGARMRPYTQSIAHKAGWQWRIPLQHRAGNGHVFCSDYISEDEATQALLDNLEGKPLADPRVIPFKVGRREKFWHKNCIAVGLSSGFLEPLESTSIHLIQTSIVRFVQMFPSLGLDASNVAEYNEQVGFEFESIRDFIILHYHATERDDSAFWKRCREMEIPESLKHKMDLFRETGRIFRFNNELFSEAGWLQVMLGQRVMPKAYHPMADALDEAQLRDYFNNLRTIIGGTVPKLPTQKDFIAKHCAAPGM